MRIALISDIHSNLAALEAVLADAGPVDETWCVGDVVGYGPDPNECVDLLRARKHLLCVAGNHDRAAIGKMDTRNFNPDAEAAAQWTSRQLTPSSRRFLEELPPARELEQHDITIVHGSPREPIWEYMIYSSIAQANVELLNTRYCFVGHTHIPVMFNCASGPLGHTCRTVTPVYDVLFKLADGYLFVNPGSVGQPRDDNPDASYVVLDLPDHTVTYRRVPYDVQKTQRKMQKAGLPQRLWMRLSYGW
ncbi:MAG: metallophosphoesterase family protein [Chloroflexi bacterium]|nr:metallophosphoesterase family protein [Chloroflexota bacterium]